MKRATTVLALPLLFACYETPTQVPSDLQPQFAVEVGTGATWHFEGAVNLIYGDPAEGVAIGDFVKGSVTFTFLSEDGVPDPCYGGFAVHTAWQYTVNGTQYTLETSTGQASGRLACYNGIYGATNVLYGTEWNATRTYRDRMWRLWLFNADTTEDFPLIPPDLTEGQVKRFEAWTGMNNVGFVVELTALYTDPVSKDDCKDGGWVGFHFQNQGQCVRFMETGTDSR